MGRNHISDFHFDDVLTKKDESVLMYKNIPMGAQKRNLSIVKFEPGGATNKFYVYGTSVRYMRYSEI